MELRSLGKYRLMAPLPVPTSTCEFFLAAHEDEPDTGRPSYVAKLLTRSRGPDADRRRKQFEHESKLLTALNHPSIPSLHAAGDQDGIPYIVMDRVDGVDLATLLGHDTDEPRGLSKEIAVYIMGQIADALRHVHGLTDPESDAPLGVLHRDICPANILLSRSGDAVLCDFGRAHSSWLADGGDEPTAGNLAYMAPERIAAEGKADGGTELFAMAVMLWEMLRGERCLAGSDDATTMDNITRFDIGQASRRVPGLSPKLSEIVRKNLDRDPGRRYTGAYQMLQRLAQSPEAQSAETSRGELGELVAKAQRA